MRIGDWSADVCSSDLLEDNVIMGGLSGAQQFVRIGRGAIIGAMAGAKSDVIPYGMVMGRPGLLAGLNLVGLKRAGVDTKEIQDLRKAYDEMFGAAGTFAERVDAVAHRLSGRGPTAAPGSILLPETLRPRRPPA